MGNQGHIAASRGADPRRVADVTLAAAVRAAADTVYIEPLPGNDAAYTITFERANEVLTNLTIGAPLGTAVIARLAYLAEIDLAAPHASSGLLPVRSGTLEANLAITVRPGANLRADVLVMPRHHAGPPPLPKHIIPVDPKPGDTIAQYRVHERIGAGGMGTVFRVEHVALRRFCALKILRNDVVERDPLAAHRLLREARTVARLHHPNIVEVFDFGHMPDGRPYFVMELLEGESLARRIARGPLPVDEVITIARKLATALAAAHEHGVIHADVTPSNVVVTGLDLDVKLVDFGLAELTSEMLREEPSSFVLGTLSYISPEQLRGFAATDRSDQYGLGAVLYELLTGHPPYEHEEKHALCLMHLRAPVPEVESPLGPLPPRLAEVITTCLQKTPEARFPGMSALLAALDDIGRITDRRGWRRWLARCPCPRPHPRPPR